MKKVLLLCSFIFASINLFSQTLDWAKHMGGIAQDRGLSVTTDNSGNVYVTGFFSDTADFDPGPATFNLYSLNGYDIYVTKLDSAGNLLWSKQIAGAGNDDRGFSIAADVSGNVYVAGQFNGAADFDPGPGTFTLTPFGWWDAFILKLDASGNFIWADQIGGVNSDVAQSLVLDTNGNLFVTGSFTTTADFDPDTTTFNLTSAGSSDIFVLKLDTSGNFKWAKKMGGPSNENASAIALDSSGNIYTTGYFNDTVDFDPGPASFTLIPFGMDDVFMSKLDSSGNFIWAKLLGGPDLDHSFSITVDGIGSAYITGMFNGTCDFDPGPGTYNLTAIGGLNIFIIKLDSSGNFVWAEKPGGPGGGIGFDVSHDQFGNIYYTGQYSGTIDADPGPGIFFLNSGVSGQIFISKLDSSGNFTWAISMGGSLIDVAYSIALDHTGNIYSTGIYGYTTADFDPGPGVYNLPNNGDLDVFVHKMSQCPGLATPGAISGNTTVCAGSSNTYSVGAVAGATSYLWTLPSGWTGTSGTTSISTTAGTTSDTIYVRADNGCSVSVQQILFVTVSTLDTSVSVAGNTLTASASSATYQWINCSGNTPVPGETNQSFTPSVNGNYTVVVTQGGCSDTSSCRSIILAGIKETGSKASFVLSPNPNSGIFSIITSEKIFSMVIHNLLGEKIFLKTEIDNFNPEFDLSKQPPGIYFFTAKTKEQTFQGKIIIQQSQF